MNHISTLMRMSESKSKASFKHMQSLQGPQADKAKQGVRRMEQIKSKQRVTDHGEVFTSEREVNAMLDLVKSETERVDSRFLEPACGTGNFLEAILERKLRAILRYKPSRAEYEKNMVVAVGSIYGIDLLEDNVTECRDRLCKHVAEEYRRLFRGGGQEFLETLRYVLSKNIVCGDALTMKDLSGEPIVFSEWSPVMELMIKRRDFSFSELLRTGNNKQTSLLDSGWESLERKAEFVPCPVREYPMTHYMEVNANG
jgi:hypothetical protein